MIVLKKIHYEMVESGIEPEIRIFMQGFQRDAFILTMIVIS